MNQELIKVVETEGLDKNKSQLILENFTGLFDKAKEWEIKAKAIVITDITQIVEMQQAREARLVLKDIRVNAERTRKELKEQSLREGKAIDGIANVIKALVIPIEEYLERQEKFAELKEQDRKQKIYDERIAQLQPYVVDITVYNLREISDEAFADLLFTSKKNWEEEQARAKKAEEEQIAKEKAEVKEREYIRLENEKLKKEKEIQEKASVVERTKANEKLKKEAQARKKAEGELQAKKDAELKAKADAKAKIDAEKEAKAEVERQALLLPAKDKLFAWAESIKSIEGPKGLSKGAEQIVKSAERSLLAISQEIKIKIKNL